MQPHVALLMSTLLLSGCHNEQPRQSANDASKSETAPQIIPRFDGERAFRFLLQQVSFGPRNPNSTGHQQCLEYFQVTLRALADEVEMQEFTHRGYGGEKLRLTNVIARFRPELQSRMILCAHWDTRPRADQDSDPTRRNEPILGANDGASGVAVLLEIATLLKATPPPIGVDIVLFDGEDYGREGDHAFYLLGSKHFARNIPAGYTPRFGILLDMVGDASLEIPREDYSVKYAPDIVELIWSTARELGRSEFVERPGMPVIDDHLPLNEVGIKTVDLIDFQYPDQSHSYWHTHNDTPDKCSAASLEAVGSVVTHILYREKP